MKQIKKAILVILLGLVTFFCSGQTSVVFADNFQQSLPLTKSNVLYAGSESVQKTFYFRNEKRWLFNLFTGHSFDGSISVKYFIPESANYAAVLLLNEYGKVIRQYSISGSGKGYIELSELPRDICQYSLMINGDIVDSKPFLKY